MAAEQVTYELKEPAAPEALLPYDYSWMWWLSVPLLALILVAAFGLWRKRSPFTQSPQSIRNLAFKEAMGALDRIAAANARAAAVEASLILRKYLSLAADDPALFETHEEFISRQNSLAALTESARSACTSGFARLAFCKYGPQIPDLQTTTVVSEARDLLDTLHRGFHG